MIGNLLKYSDPILSLTKLYILLHLYATGNASFEDSGNANSNDG